jgi:hypothetical protein
MSGDIKGTAEGTCLKKKSGFFLCEFFSSAKKYWKHHSEGPDGQAI